ncbi:MAG: viperin family antiviral radical SAM protein [Bacteroidota bacterium]
MSKEIKTTVSDLVINYHVTEACNYGCKYCYARWSDYKRDEIHGDLKKVDKLFFLLKKFFQPDNFSNPISKFLSWENIRLNFAGGEPFLVGKRFEDLIFLAEKYDFKISIITNGSLITDRFVNTVGQKISMLGVSIDSDKKDTLEKIGRCNKRDEPLDFDKLKKQIQNLKKLNKDAVIKINTVINSLNCNEDLNSLICMLGPDKWKLLQVLPVVNNELNITKEQFTTFVNRHTKYKNIIVEEDNNAMTNSYIMINPEGCFYQNSLSAKKPGEDYVYSSPILDVGVENAFNEIKFNWKLFSKRY